MDCKSHVNPYAIVAHKSHCMELCVCVCVQYKQCVCHHSLRHLVRPSTRQQHTWYVHVVRRRMCSSLDVDRRTDSMRFDVGSFEGWQQFRKIWILLIYMGIHNIPCDNEIVASPTKKVKGCSLSLKLLEPVLTVTTGILVLLAEFQGLPAEIWSRFWFSPWDIGTQRDFVFLGTHNLRRPPQRNAAEYHEPCPDGRL